MRIGDAFIRLALWRPSGGAVTLCRPSGVTVSLLRLLLASLLTSCNDDRTGRRRRVRTASTVTSVLLFLAVVAFLKVRGARTSREAGGSCSKPIVQRTLTIWEGSPYASNSTMPPSATDTRERAERRRWVRRRGLEPVMVGRGGGRRQDERRLPAEMTNEGRAVAVAMNAAATVRGRNNAARANACHGVHQLSRFETVVKETCWSAGENVVVNDDECDGLMMDNRMRYNYIPVGVAHRMLR